MNNIVGENYNVEQDSIVLGVNTIGIAQRESEFKKRKELEAEAKMAVKLLLDMSNEDEISMAAHLLFNKAIRNAAESAKAEEAAAVLRAIGLAVVEKRG